MKRLAMAWLRHEMARRASADLSGRRRDPAFRPGREPGQVFRAVVQINLAPRLR